MSALHSLGLDGAFGNPSILGDGVSLHQWVINIIKENNLTSNSVTNGLLHDLLARLVMKHHRHAQHDPKRQLTKAHIAHIVGFMICRMGLEEVTPKVVRTVWNYIPKEEPPNALWTGIDSIKKHAARGRAPITGVEGVAADGRPEGGGECVGDHVMVSKMIMLMEQEEEKERALLAEELVTVGDMEQMVLILVEGWGRRVRRLLY